MSKLQSLFKKPIFIANITAGHHGLLSTKLTVEALANGGVDIIEMGIPFSDPIADGPIIQKAMTESLMHPTTLKDIFATIKEIKQEIKIPIVLMSYYNPILSFNGNNFYQTAGDAGVDGLLIMDLPFEESGSMIENCRKFNIDPICIISPTTSRERIQKLTQQDYGYIYYLSRNQITGIKEGFPADLGDHIQEIKQISKLPVVAGLGISSQEMAKEALKYADGFVIGSKIIESIIAGLSFKDLTKLAKSLDPR